MSDKKEEIELNLTDEEALRYMKMAHELDITFNEFVERALLAAIEKHEKNNDDKSNS
jgi:hypothetical protein